MTTPYAMLPERVTPGVKMDRFLMKRLVVRHQHADVGRKRLMNIKWNSNKRTKLTVTRPAWPESHGFGLAFNGSGFQNLQAGPEPSMTAGFGSALARAAAGRGKMHYKSNILSTKRFTVSYRELSVDSVVH
jgi:hypothetical protein